MVTNLENVLVLHRDFGALDKDLSRLRFDGSFFFDCKIGETETQLIIEFEYTIALVYGILLGYNTESVDLSEAYVETKPVADPPTPPGVVSYMTEAKILGDKTIKVAKIPEELPIVKGDIVTLESANDTFYYEVNTVDTTDSNFDLITLYQGLKEAKAVGQLVYYKGLAVKSMPIIKDKDFEFGKFIFGGMNLYNDLRLVVNYKHTAGALTADKKIHFVLAYHHGEYSKNL